MHPSPASNLESLSMPPSTSKKPLTREELIESVGTKRGSLSNEDANLIQRPFLVALKKKMDDDGLSPTQLAKKLGIPYSYIVAIINGMRLIGNAERSKIEIFAEYLQVPIVQIYIWGGLLSPKDFVVKLGLSKTLDNVFKIMQEDHALTNILPTIDEWRNKKEFSESAKLVIAQIYELYSNKMLMERANLQTEAPKTKRSKHILNR